MRKTFISYSRKDGEFIGDLRQELEASGFDVWVDKEEIEGGSAWRAAISEAIRDCEAFLVVLSSHSVASQNVTKELSLAEHHQKRIIPILVTTCDIPPEIEYQLAGLQWVDFQELPREEAMKRLVRALELKSRPRTESDEDDATPPPPRARPASAKPPPIPTAAPVPPQPFSPQPAAPPSLAQIVVGRWNIQVTAPYRMGAAQIAVEFAPNGFFQGQLFAEGVMSVIQGQWQVTPMNQLVFQGQQSANYMVLPYQGVLQFTQITPNQLSGTSNMGEQVLCQRVG